MKLNVKREATTTTCNIRIYPNTISTFLVLLLLLPPRAARCLPRLQLQAIESLLVTLLQSSIHLVLHLSGL